MKKNQRQGEAYLFLPKLYWLVLLCVLSITACKKEPTQGPEQLTDEMSSEESRLPRIVVHAGGSIQAAVDAAVGATIILIEPGTYKEAILVEKPGIQLIGIPSLRGRVIIDNPGEANNGITVRDAGDGFVLKYVTIQNFRRNGVFMIRADNFVLAHIKTINNGEYGLYPIRCNNGLISSCSATGHTDTGIYVGQSTDVKVLHNIAFANVSGIEIENCTNIDVSWNKCYDNAAGLLVFLLPGLTVKTSSDVSVTHNDFSNNNHVNFAPPGSGFEVFIPSGSGILLVGSDNTTITQNIVSRNNFVGIATVSTLVLGALAGIPPSGFADIEPNPDGTKIQYNLVKNNGAAPPPGLPLPAADLLWDGSGTNNCWKSNLFSIAVPGSLPACN